MPLRLDSALLGLDLTPLGSGLTLLGLIPLDLNSALLGWRF